MIYRIAEKFISINGEGQKAGTLAVFIRFTGCNLDCSYCDTKWANKDDCVYEELNENEIDTYIENSGIQNITITGGEPLMQEGIKDLLVKLSENQERRIEIETNGSKDISFINKELGKNISITMDYKLPSSEMEGTMLLDNLELLDIKDTLKFVAGDLLDLEKTLHIIKKYKLLDKTNIYISPVYGKIELDDIVNWMKDNKLNNVTLQLQLHKIIWGNKKGV